MEKVTYDSESEVSPNATWGPPFGSTFRQVHFVVPVPPETRSPMSGMGFWDSAGKVLFCGRLKMWNLRRGIWLFVYHSCGPS